MILTEKETNAIEDLKTQEQACIEKYTCLLYTSVLHSEERLAIVLGTEGDGLHEQTIDSVSYTQLDVYKRQHYATSTRQAPKYAQPGQDAIESEVQLELKVIADVGLVGFPNVAVSYTHLGMPLISSSVSVGRPSIK